MAKRHQGKKFANLWSRDKKVTAQRRRIDIQSRDESQGIIQPKPQKRRFFKRKHKKHK